MVKKYYTQLSVAVLFAMSAGASIVSAQGSPNPAHAHIGHVMTSWKDTPDAKGFLPTAIADAQVAMEQIERADLEGRINDFVLYGGYVLNALDPGAETDALLKTAYARLPTNYVKIEVPGTGYGIKRGVAGALQHVQLASRSEGASENVKTHAAHATASLENVAKWTGEAIATARKLIAAKDVGGGQILVDELTAQIGQIAIGTDANGDGQTGWQTGEGGLRQANTHMRLMMKGEGL
ncbi:MAG: hypothetical protein EHM55_00475 [Acidobacteria bacterium]|nr:MAG: hypothetical protein EHM55_00475 [Acidobacteriota bacterium]